jgi:hypothetical protein
LAAAALALTCAAQTAFAIDWNQADALYAQREGNRQVIAQARTAYLAILNQATEKADKIRAVAQLGRLAVYEGEMILPKTARDERRAIFEQCWCADPRVSLLGSGSCHAPGFVDKISPAAIGESHPAYTYFRSICLAYWGEQGTLPEKLAFTSKLTETLDQGRALDTRYEGAGILRVAAGVYSNPATRPLGIYNPEEALSIADQALSSQPYPGDPSGGANYYDNWQGKVSVLIQLHADDPNGGYGQQAQELAQQKLTEMDEKLADDDLPEARGPEFKHFYKKIKEQYHDLTGQDWNP